MKKECATIIFNSYSNYFKIFQIILYYFLGLLDWRFYNCLYLHLALDLKINKERQENLEIG